MMKLFYVARQEYLNRVKTKGFLIGTLVIPVVTLLLLLAPILLSRMDTEKPMTFAVVDSTGNLYPEFAGAFSDTLGDGDLRYRFEDYLRGHRTETDWVPRLSEETKNGTIDGFFVIPLSFHQGERARFYAMTVSDMERNERFENVIEDLARKHRIVESGLTEEFIQDILSPPGLATFRVGESGGVREDSGQTFAIAYLFSFIFYISLVLYGLATLRTTLEEKVGRTAELMVSHVRPIHLMGGKILGVGGVGLTQLSIWFLVAAFLILVGNSLPGPMSQAAAQIRAVAPGPAVMVIFFAFFTFGFLFYSGFFVSAGAMVNSETEAQQLQTPLTMPIVFAFIIAIVMGIRSPDSTVIQVLSFIPFFSPILMMVRACVLMPPLWQILLSLGLLILSTWGSIWMSARIFRVGLLMYGKRPNLPELLRWIRQG